MLKIEVRQDLNLAQIMQLAQAGKSVVQTPHVGILPLDVLIALQAGLHVRLVDTNVGYLDKLFYPHLVVSRGISTQVAEPHLLVTHATVTSTPPGKCAKHFQPGNALSNAHVAATRAAFPGADIVSYAEWLRPHQEIILSLLEIITHLHPKVWERRVNSNGVTENAQHAGVVPTWKLIAQQGICGITVPANASGWVLPNPVAILVDIFVDAVQGRTEQYPLSGPSMATYIQQDHRNFGPMDALLACWYGEGVRLLPKLKLPPKFTVKMVPAASWKFAVPFHLKDHLDALIDWYFNHKRSQIDLAQGIAMGIIQPKTTAKMKRADREQLAQLLKPIRLWFAGQDTPMFGNQYDVLAHQTAQPVSDPLYIHPIVRHTSVKSLAHVMAHIRAMI